MTVGKLERDRLMSKFGNSAKIVQNCERQRSRLWREFERVRPRLTKIARYVYPNALAGLVEDIKNLGVPDDYEDDDIDRFTNVPFDAFRIAYSGFYTNLTNPASSWFRLGAPEFNRNEEEKDFYAREYEKVTETTRWLMGWCGSYRALHLVYKHLIAFGFAAMLLENDEDRIVRCQCLRMGTYALGIDRKGKVDRVLRHFAFTAEQMAEEFGAENLPYNIKEAAKRGDAEARFEVWNIVEPHRKLAGVRAPYTLDYGKFVYRSVYWSAEANGNGQNGLLAVRGYMVKPVVAPRLTFEIGDIYGRGCGADVLGHCRALQKMAESQLDLADQMAHPSIMAPASMADDGLRLGAWAVNYYQDGLQPNAVYRTIGNPPAGELTANEQARLEHEIRKAFFNSEFETINALQDQSAAGGLARGGSMTATEVKARVNEKMEQLAGIATTLNDELLDPFVTAMAAFAMMSGIVDANLPEGAGDLLPWDIRYESAIHAAVNAQPINAAINSMATAGQFASMTQDAGLFDNFDSDAMVRDIHRKMGAPQRYLMPVKERDAIREQRAQAQQQAQQMQADAIQAKTIKDLASASVSPETLGGSLAAAGQKEGVS